MIDEKDPTGPAERTRPYTWPEVLRAVAHVLSRPGGPSHTPEVSHHSGMTDALIRVYDHVEKRPLDCSDALLWARVMDRVDEVRVSPGSRYVHVYVTGVIAGGPRAEVLVFLDRDLFPIEVGVASRQITVDELVAMAEQSGEAVDESVARERVLAGAR